MNPVLTIIYYVLYTLVKTGLQVYYRIGPGQGLPATEPKGPLIVLGNHPNALLDPFMVVSHLTRPVYFLGNASLFKHWFANWFLNTFYTIPIERPKDVGGRPIDNAQAFRRSREHLMMGGALYIAPEGTSEREYRLRPIKTGAARIALNVLQADPHQSVAFLLGGITYEDHPAFRSRVSIHFDCLVVGMDDLPGPADEWATVEWLTELLERKMQGLLLHSTPEQDERLMRSLDLLRPWLWGSGWRKRLQTLQGHLLHSGDQAEAWLSTLNQLVAQKGLTAVDPRWLDQKEPLIRLVLLPLAVMVLLHHAVIYGLPELLKRRLKLHLVYDATVRFLGGLIGYLVGVPLLWWMMGQVCSSWEIRLLWLGMVLVSGPWSWQQWLFFQRIRQWRSFQKATRDRQWLDTLRTHLSRLSEQAE